MFTVRQNGEVYLHDRLHFEIVYTRIGVHAGYLPCLLRTVMHFFFGLFFSRFLIGICGFLLFLLFSGSFGVITARNHRRAQ